MVLEIKQETALKNTRSINFREWLDLFKKLKKQVTSLIVHCLPIILTSFIYIFDIFSNIGTECMIMTPDTFSTARAMIFTILILWVFRSRFFASDLNPSRKKVLTGIISSILNFAFIVCCMTIGLIDYHLDSGLTRQDYYSIIFLISIASMANIGFVLNTNRELFLVNKNVNKNRVVNWNNNDSKLKVIRTKKSVSLIRFFNLY